MFSQLGNVGKTQAAMREGQQIQATIHQTLVQMKYEENVRSVNETQEMDKETATIKDQKGGGANAGKGGAHGEQEEEEALTEEVKAERIRDPALGRNIDISG